MEIFSQELTGSTNGISVFFSSWKLIIWQSPCFPCHLFFCFLFFKYFEKIERVSTKIEGGPFWIRFWRESAWIHYASPTVIYFFCFLNKRQMNSNDSIFIEKYFTHLICIRTGKKKSKWFIFIPRNVIVDISSLYYTNCLFYLR